MSKQLTAISLAVFLSITCIAQQDTLSNKFSSQDSVCLEKIYAWAALIKHDGKEAKYFTNEHFFLYLTASNTIKLLNIGDDKVLTFKIAEMNLTGVDSSGQPSNIRLTSALELVSEKELPHCSSMSINLGKVTVPKFTSIEVKNIKVILKFGDTETVATLGKNE